MRSLTQFINEGADEQTNLLVEALIECKNESEDVIEEGWWGNMVDGFKAAVKMVKDIPATAKVWYKALKDVRDAKDILKAVNKFRKNLGGPDKWKIKDDTGEAIGLLTFEQSAINRLKELVAGGEKGSKKNDEERVQSKRTVDISGDKTAQELLKIFDDDAKQFPKSAAKVSKDGNQDLPDPKDPEATVKEPVVTPDGSGKDSNKGNAETAKEINKAAAAAVKTTGGDGDKISKAVKTYLGIKESNEDSYGYTHLFDAVNEGKSSDKIKALFIGKDVKPEDKQKRIAALCTLVAAIAAFKDALGAEPKTLSSFITSLVVNKDIQAALK